MIGIRRLLTVAALFVILPLAQVRTSAQILPAMGAMNAQVVAATGDKLDINTATPDQLKAFSGIGDAYAKRIIDGRPYTMKTQLVTKGVLPQATYNKIKDNIVASKVKK